MFVEGTSCRDILRDLYAAVLVFQNGVVQRSSLAGAVHSIGLCGLGLKASREVREARVKVNTLSVFCFVPPFPPLPS